MSPVADVPAVPGVAPPPGWYPDPLGHFQHRFWDGARWTQRAAWNGALYDDAAVSGPEPVEIEHLDYMQSYLLGAVQRGVVRPRDVDRLLEEIRSWERLPHLGPPSPASRAAEPAPPSVTPTWQPPAPAAPIQQPAPVHVVPIEPTAASDPAPGALRRRVGRMVHVVSADLAVHWFADLGALLLFVGLFGFVAFAFADVQVGLRPLAELAIPLTMFGAGAFLRRRGTPAVADVLILLGGALVPIVVIAAFSDGATPPMDLQGAALAGMLTGTLGAVAVAMALIAWRRPSTPLRFLVAPMVWLAVAAAGLGLERAVPTGSDLATPTAAQWSLVLVAIAFSALVADRWRRQSWAQAVLAASWPGLTVAFLITATSAGAEGWPIGPVVVGAAAAAAALEVLARRWILATTLAQSVIVTGAAIAVADTWGAPRTVAVLTALAILAAEARTREGAPAPVPVGLAVAALGSWAVTLGTAGGQPWAAVTSSFLVWAWALSRHRRPGLLVPVAWNTMLWFALIPLAMSMAVAVSDPAAQLGLAGLVVAVAVGLRLRPTWADELWSAWVPSVAAATLVWLLVTLPPAAVAAQVAAALLIVAFAAAPRWPVLRLWTGTAAATTAIGGLLWRADVGLPAAAAILAATGCALVVAAEIRRGRLAGHVGLIGLLAAGISPMVAAVAADPGRDRVSLTELGVSTAAMAALILLAVTEEVRGSTLADLLERALLRSAAFVSSSVSRRAVLVTRRLALIAALPATAIVVTGWIDNSGVLPPTSAWLAVVPVGVMTAVLVGARLVEPHRRPAATIASLEALAISCLVAGITAPAPGPRVVALGLIVAQALLAGPRLQRELTTWVGWVAGGLLIPAVTAITDLPDDLAGFPLQVAGAATAIGVLLIRRRHPGEPASVGSPLPPALLAPIVTGSVLAAIGLAVGLGGSETIAGAACALGAATALMAVLLVDAPWASLAPWILGVSAFGLFLPIDPQQRPWVWVPVAAVIVVAATVLRPDEPATDWWRRWDVPPLVVAAGLGFVSMGLGLGAGAPATTATWCGMGGLTLAVGVQRRWVAAIAVGAGAVVVGTGVAGPSWLAASLLGVAAASAVGVTRTAGAARTMLRWTAALAASGSWISLLVRVDGGAVPTSVATALLGALVAIAVALALQLGLIDRTGAFNIALPGTVAVTLAGIWWLGVASLPDRSGWLIALAVAGAAGGTGAAAGPMGWPWLRELGATTALSAGGFVIAATAPSIDQVTLVATAAALVSAVTVLGLRVAATGGPWRRPLAIDATSLLVVALASSSGASAGAGTFALVATSALAIAVAAAARPGPARVGAQVVAAGAVPLTWWRTVQWVDMPADRWVPATALIGGVALAALGVSARRRPDRGWVLTVLVPSAFMVTGAVAALYATGTDEPTAGIGVAVGVFLAAVGAAVAARPLSQPWLRGASAVTAWFAVAISADALGADRTQLTVAAASIALGATFAVVVLSVTQRAASWVPPLEVTAVAGTLMAWLLVDWGQPAVVATGLLLTGAVLAAFGVTRHQPPLLLAAPWALCGAWLVVARSSLDGDPVWFTVPIGLTVLATTSLARQQRRRDGQTPGSALLSALEYVGVALMVVTPLAQAVATNLVHVATSLAIGVGLSAWGVVTRVRHRLAAGAAVIGLSVLVLVLVPMVDVSRRITGSGIWLALAAAGLVAIIIATLVERSRRLAQRSVRRLRELTAGWE